MPGTGERRFESEEDGFINNYARNQWMASEETENYSLEPTEQDQKVMDFAIWKAMQTGDFEPMLDVLDERNVHCLRNQADNETALMAAAYRGRPDLVQLLIHLGCHPWRETKSNKNIYWFTSRAKVDSDIRQRMVDIIDQNMPYTLDEKGQKQMKRPKYDTCAHKPEDRHLDTELGIVSCVECATVLAGNVFNDPIEESPMPGKVTDEFARDMEDLTLLMKRHGIVSNEKAERKAVANSIVTKQRFALTWLAERRRKRRALLSKKERQFQKEEAQGILHREKTRNSTPEGAMWLSSEALETQTQRDEPAQEVKNELQEDDFESEDSDEELAEYEYEIEYEFEY